MINLKTSFKEKFMRDIPLEIRDDYPTHMPVEEMIEIACAASRKIGMNCYVALKHFKFTDEEIKNHLRHCHASQ